MMEQLSTDLDKVKISVKPPTEVNLLAGVKPTIEGSTSRVEKSEAPGSYHSNNHKEELLLVFAENFQRQFRQLYSDRKPLLLTPLNEYGIPKFICTSMRPTYLKYKELYEYDGCSSFVADYLAYEPLNIPNEMPSTVVSTTMVLREQRGNCFDYAILLASLLIGVGYDAYCVCGYASQDVCLLNLGRNTCPLLVDKEEVKEEKVEQEKNRYKVRPLRDFSSSFEKRQIATEKAKMEAEKKKKEEEAAAKIAAAEAPPSDQYYGLRIHCWVLVLMGKRDVGRNFFIEPTTGETHPLDWDQYQGIETLWNHKNYWVNMQDCSGGVKGLSYDLGDAAIWEFFFPNVEKPLLVIPGEEIILGDDESEEPKPSTSSEKEDFQLPPSWVLPYDVTAKDIETRCPNGSKTILYYHSKLEKFAEYLNHTGLVSRLTLYSDTARTNRSEVRCSFKHRKDRLNSRVELVKPGQIVESFGPGRERSLKAHTHYDSNPLRAGNRTLEFYSYARVDGLVKRVITPSEMEEHYKDRSDFMYYRHVIYEKLTKKQLAEQGKDKPRQILTVVDKFHPNPAIPPNNDMAERTLLFTENQVRVVHQLEEGKTTASFREFVVPPMNPDQAVLLTFDPDGTTSYQADPYVKDPKNRKLFEQLETLVQAREDTVTQIRQSEKETENILNARHVEESNTVLNISVYDVVRNETARTHRQELERRLAEEEQIRREKEKDYLAPFLARIGDPPELSIEQKRTVPEACLQDLRSRLVNMANIIQGRFECETENLQQKQDWYKSNQGSLTKEEESDYTTFCKDKMFTIHILEERLKRLKETAPQVYLNLERRLEDDPRVIYFAK